MRGHLGLASGSFRDAIWFDGSNAAYNYALGDSLLAQGEYKLGFRLAEFRHGVSEFKRLLPAPPFPQWSGESLNGKHILVWPDQGFGDHIQFFRFIPHLARSSSKVTLLCPPPLVEIFQRDDVDVIAAERSVEIPDPDFFTYITSLAANLQITLDALPAKPYLNYGNQGSRTREVGLMTRGNPFHANDKHRSLDSRTDARLRKLIKRHVDLHPDQTRFVNFRQTADLIATLSAVVSVDTSVAHLCGALGVKTFLLLTAHHTDWRWISRSGFSVWYPSIRVIKQDSIDDWDGALDVLASELRLANLI